MSATSERVKALRKQNHLTQDEVAVALGLPRPTISLYENDKLLLMQDVIFKYAQLFHVSTDYLLGLSDRIEGMAGSHLGNSIPVLETVRADLPMTAMENIIGREMVPEAFAVPDAYFGLKIKGSAMEPRMFDGDVAIVQKTNQVENGQIAVVLVGKEDAVVMIFRADANGVSLTPYNEDFPELRYSLRQVEKLPLTVIGRVVEIRSRLE